MERSPDVARKPSEHPQTTAFERGSNRPLTPVQKTLPVAPWLGGKRNLRPKGEAKATPGQPASTRKAPMSKEVVQHVQVAMPHAEDTPEHCPTDVEGFTFDRDGFLTQPECWTVELAHTLAHQAGLELHERHWTVLNYLREEYAQSGSSPNIRKITIGSGVPTKELFQLFPRAPAKTAARIAGIPKPVGCV